MQYLVVNFLKWGDISCTMWGLTCCPFTQSSVVRYPRADHPAVAVRRAHRVPLDRRAQVARQVLRVQAAPRDRAVAVDHLDPALLLDPTEAPVSPAQAAAQGPADIPGLAAALAAADHPAQAAHQVALDRAVVQVHQDQAGHRVAPEVQESPVQRVPVDIPGLLAV